MNVRGTVAGLMLVGAVAGCGGSGPEAAQPRETIISLPEMDQMARQELALARAYGYPVPSRVAILAGRATLECMDGAPPQLYDADSQAVTPAYCTDPDVIVIGEVKVEQRLYAAAHNDKRLTAVGITFLLDHELAHKAQADGDKRFLERFSNNKMPYELNADCRAGEMVRRLHPEMRPDVVRFLSHFASSEQHGSSAQRVASFSKGASGEACSLSE